MGDGTQTIMISRKRSGFESLTVKKHIKNLTMAMYDDGERKSLI